MGRGGLTPLPFFFTMKGISMANPKTVNTNVVVPPTIKVTIDGKETTLPKFVATRFGKLMWADDLTNIYINSADFDHQYAELKPEMDLRRVKIAIDRGRLVPFNPKTDTFPYNRGNAIKLNADVSVLRNDEAWVLIQGAEKQVIADIRKVKDRILLERAFKYETNGFTPIHKSRVNVVDEMAKLLKKLKSRIHDSIIVKEETEEIDVS